MPSSGFSQAERGLLANLMHLNEAKCKVLHRYRAENGLRLLLGRKT